MSNKTLTEKERELLKELRQHPLEAEEIIETLSLKEIQSLYPKVDAIQEEEGKSKLYLGVLDEGYIFEWSRVKNTLLLEHSKRTQIMQMRRKKLVVIELLLFFLSAIISTFAFLTDSIMMMACNALVTSMGTLLCIVVTYKYDSDNL